MTTRMGFLTAASFAVLAAASPANAAPTLIGQFSGNECGGAGGFSNCFAFPDGTTAQGVGNGTGSPSIFKQNSDGTTDQSTRFPSITGSEFLVTYNAGLNQLSFTYTPGAGDPVIHYFAINQASSTYLYHDNDAITSGTIALSGLFQNRGYSHITFFDTGAPAVPEPATWAMMIGGFGMMGAALRRRPKVIVSYA